MCKWIDEGKLNSSNIPLLSLDHKPLAKCSLAKEGGFVQAKRPLVTLSFVNKLLGG